MRVTNVDSLSAYFDRLISEKIKWYFFDKDGKEEELKMIEFLLEKGWTGVIILDDIYKGCQMQDFWNGLSIPGWTKIDVTELGHSSGTGILFPS